MNYIKPQPEGVSKEHRDKAMEIGQPLTPRSERPRASYGSLQISLQTTPGLCASRKCFRKLGHAGDCYPKES